MSSEKMYGVEMRDDCAVREFAFYFFLFDGFGHKRIYHLYLK